MKSKLESHFGCIQVKVIPHDYYGLSWGLDRRILLNIPTKNITLKEAEEFLLDLEKAIEYAKCERNKIESEVFNGR